MMTWLSGLFRKGGAIDKITDIVDKTVTDKDARNELIYNIALVLMQSRIAPYVRAFLAAVIVVSVMFFGDKITLDPEAQQYALYAVLAFYFMDRLMSSLGGFRDKKKEKVREKILSLHCLL